MPNGGKMGLLHLLLNILRSKKKKRDTKRNETEKKQLKERFLLKFKIPNFGV
jgi:hypothetical protein